MQDTDSFVPSPLFANQQITMINNCSGFAPGYYQSPRDATCDNYVNSLDLYGDNIYIGGDFTTPESHIMGKSIITGNHFPLAKGLDQRVNAIFYNNLNNRLYAGGEFKNDGFGTPMYYISYYIASLDNWIPMGLNSGQIPGLNDHVYAITGIGLDKYIGGAFKEDNNGGVFRYITRYNSINDTFNPLKGLTYGVNNTVYAIAYDGGDYYYVGGNFQNAGGQQANNIARYSISNQVWEPLMDTTTKRNGVDGTVYTIVYDSNTSRVYVGGSFLKVSGHNFYNITYWDINAINWNYIGNSNSYNGTNGSVLTIIKDPNTNNFYIGGNFYYTDIDDSGLPINNLTYKYYNLATWDGNIWNYIGTSNTQNGTDDVVHSVFLDNTNKLYVGGDFKNIDYNGTTGINANYIAYWDSGWNLLTQTSGNGTNSFVNTITGNNSNNIYIGGNFTTVDYSGSTSGISANHIVIWQNGTTWVTLQDGGTNNGLNDTVNTLYYDIINSILYIGGLFSYAYLDISPPTTKGPYYNSVKWNGANWEYIGANQDNNGVNGEVFTIYNNPNNNNTFMGGNFKLAGYDGRNSINSVKNITYFDGGSKWFSLEYNNYNVGVNSVVYALTVINRDLYVGGNFITTAPTLSTTYNTCNYIAKWSVDNEVWYPLIYDNNGNGDIGLNGDVRALSTNGTLLFVGGDFTSTSQGSFTFNHIAIWDPTLETWIQIITLGGDIGLDNSVLGLSCRFPYEILYVCGNFFRTFGGNLDLGYIATFNLNNIGTTNGFQQILAPNGTTYGTNVSTRAILDAFPRIFFGGEFTSTLDGAVPMAYLGDYLYIYISEAVTLKILPQDLPRLFLDTRTGIISSTHILTNRFKSVILINYIEDSPLNYWLIMYRS